MKARRTAIGFLLQEIMQQNCPEPVIERAEVEIPGNHSDSVYSSPETLKQPLQKEVLDKPAVFCPSAPHPSSSWSSSVVKFS
jgi:hypothetical protein